MNDIEQKVANLQDAAAKWCKVAGELQLALVGCTARLRITLGELNQDPVDIEAPSRLDNIKAISAALAAYEEATK